jgi:DnaB helicase-like protein/AAA domain-containing protein
MSAPSTNSEARRATGRRDQLTGAKPYRTPANSSTAPNEKTPPHNVEAEMGVLGSILQSPREAITACVDKGIKAEHFYVPAHRTLYTALCDMWDSGASIDLITFTQVLRDRHLLDSVGGAAFVTSLFTFVPTAANVEYYLDIVVEMFTRRNIIRICTEKVRRCYDIQGEDSSTVLSDAEQEFAMLNGARVDDLPTPTSIIALAEADLAIFEADNLLGNRFLCKEGGMLSVGPSGIGKTSAGVQQDILWSLGRPAFGIRPTRPLKILCVQAENDDGDLAEMTRGICDHLNLTDEERKAVDERVVYIKEKAMTGEHFIRLLRRLVRKYRPDILRIDPLHAYAAGDVCDPAVTTAFLRNGLNPILQEFRCAAIVCHHTPKTTNRDTTKWNESDWMYAGAGNADVANWARAILVIDSTRVHGAFIFRAAKRGSRIGWADGEGHRAYDRLFCHHAGDAIFWRDATDDDTEAVMLAKGKRGEAPRTKEDLKALVPLDEEIPKPALIHRANMKGFGLNHAKRLLSDLIADKELHEVRRPRRGTGPEVLISRREETLI